MELLAVHEELDISGGADLDKRPGLRPAVEAIEVGDADVLVAAYFDRFFRSVKVQTQVVERVEAAGGEVLTVDVGRVTSDTAAQWLSATQMGLMSEYVRRSGRERTAEGIQRAINRGALPWPRVPAGYRKRDDGTYEPDPETAPVVARAFGLRARGTTVREVRAYLRAHGIDMTYSGVVKLLKSRVVLGEIHFGKFTPNLVAHEPIVARHVWEAVQHTRVPSGRNTKNPRLLARLGVLRCGTCDSRMVASIAIGAGGHRYEIYRCQNTDCTRRVTIACHRVEAIVTEGVRERLADVEGQASLDANARDAERALERAQDALDAAVSAFQVLGDELSARAKLVQLRDARDAARERVDRLGGQGRPKVASVVDWDVMTTAERRALIRATVERVTVSPGRGDRVALFFFE